MGNIVDFEKAKEASNKKKNEKIKKSRKHERIIKKYRKIDEGKNNKALYFYMLILLAVVIFVIFR